MKSSKRGGAGVETNCGTKTIPYLEAKRGKKLVKILLKKI